MRNVILPSLQGCLFCLCSPGDCYISPSLKNQSSFLLHNMIHAITQNMESTFKAEKTWSKFACCWVLHGTPVTISCRQCCPCWSEKKKVFKSLRASPFRVIIVLNHTEASNNHTIWIARLKFHFEISFELHRAGCSSSRSAGNMLLLFQRRRTSSWSLSRLEVQEFLLTQISFWLSNSIRQKLFKLLLNGYRKAALPQPGHDHHTVAATRSPSWHWWWQLRVNQNCADRREAASSFCPFAVRQSRASW